MSPTPGVGGGTDDAGAASWELDERLSGDLSALEAFARQLAPAGEPDPGARLPGRINVDTDTVGQDLARLVLAVIELLRELMEQQVIRRIEAGSLTDDEIERIGATFLQLERKLAELKRAFGIREDDALDLNLGPLLVWDE